MKTLSNLIYVTVSVGHQSLVGNDVAGWVLRTANLPQGGLYNSMDRITDLPDMTSDLDRGRKALKNSNF